MAARVVTDEEIITVCEAMRAEGHTSFRRQEVYERLGRRGGMTTINRVIGEWERRQRAPAPPPPLRLLPEDQQAILDFGTRMLEILTVRLRAEMDGVRAAADKQIALERAQAADMAEAAEALQNDIEQERTAIARDRADWQERLDRLQADLAATAARAEEAESAFAAATRDADELRGRLAVATMDLDNAERRQAHAEGRAQALEQRIGELRESMETERRTHQAALAERDAAHRQALAEARDEGRRAAEALERLLEEERAGRRAGEARLAAASDQLRALERDAAAAHGREAESRARADTLQRQLDTVLARLGPVAEQHGPPLPPSHSPA